MSLSRKLAVAVTLSIVSLSAGAAVRLTYSMGGAPTPLYWSPAAFPIPYQIEPRLANVIGQPAVDGAFDSWTHVDTATVRFKPVGVVQGARTGNDGLNTVGLVD